MINRRELDEGDLFGVRALEGGYFGGVAQSRPSSPSPSYVLTPETSVTDLSKTDNRSGNLSASSSTSDLLGPATAGAKKEHKPSPLRLHDVQAGTDFGRPPVSPSASSVGGVGGSYIPPTGKHSSKGLESGTQPSGWVSPLDIHFSKSKTPTSPATPLAPRPRSYLPRLNFPPTETGARSQVGSIIGSEISQYTSKPVTKSQRSDVKSTTVAVEPTRGRPGVDSPAGSIYHPYVPSRGRETSRSIFPAVENSHRSLSRPRSIKNGQASRSAASPPPRSGVSGSRAKDSSNENEQAVIRDSSKRPQRVSISHQSKATQESTAVPKQAITAPQSAYQNPFLGHARDDSEGSEHMSRPSRSRTISVSSRSSKSISRTRDSIRRASPAHTRKISVDRYNRHSRDRDQLHYDPTSHHRSRSGSVQGRAVDFDRPRESPFANINAIPSLPSLPSSANHSNSSSVSSFESSRQHHQSIPSSEFRTTPARGHGLPNTSQGTTHLVAPGGRGRSESEASQASISDFYDSYYRQSAVPNNAATVLSSRRDSATIQRSNQYISLSNDSSSPYLLNPPSVQGSYFPHVPAPTPPPRSSRRLSQSSDGSHTTINSGFDVTTGRKAPPAPLNIRPAGVGETIIEMPTPRS
jgi:hypothetical protein